MGKDVRRVTHFVADSGLPRYGEAEAKRLWGQQGIYRRGRTLLRGLRRDFRRIAALCAELTPAGAGLDNPDAAPGGAFGRMLEQLTDALYRFAGLEPPWES